MKQIKFPGPLTGDVTDMLDPFVCQISSAKITDHCCSGEFTNSERLHANSHCALSTVSGETNNENLLVNVSEEEIKNERTFISSPVYIIIFNKKLFPSFYLIVVHNVLRQLEPEWL